MPHHVSLWLIMVGNSASMRPESQVSWSRYVVAGLPLDL